MGGPSPERKLARHLMRAVGLLSVSVGRAASHIWRGNLRARKLVTILCRTIWHFHQVTSLGTSYAVSEHITSIPSANLIVRLLTLIVTGLVCVTVWLALLVATGFNG